MRFEIQKESLDRGPVGHDHFRGAWSHVSGVLALHSSRVSRGSK